jgi:hypothetical protein
MKVMNRTKFTSFDDLATFTPAPKALSVVPRRRHYLSEVDAVYDFSVGHDFLVVDPTSPFDGCFVTLLDKHVLKQHGYTAVDITYNNDRNVEIAL